MFMMIDTYFEGQEKSGDKTHEAGDYCQDECKKFPSAILVDQNFWEKYSWRNSG